MTEPPRGLTTATRTKGTVLLSSSASDCWCWVDWERLGWTLLHEADALARLADDGCPNHSEDA